VFSNRLDPTKNAQCAGSAPSVPRMEPAKPCRDCVEENAPRIWDKTGRTPRAVELSEFRPDRHGYTAVVSIDSSPFRVVVIDDSTPFRELLIDYLEGEESFAVVGEADDGVAAEALIDLTDPDVVILDVHLPSVSGLEVLERARGHHADTLFVVNSSDDGIQAEATRLGADVVVDKTTPFDEICEAIVRAEDDPPRS
jgi:CheY-like chemotaxis protein